MYRNQDGLVGLQEPLMDGSYLGPNMELRGLIARPGTNCRKDADMFNSTLPLELLRRATVDLNRLEHGCWMIYAGFFLLAWGCRKFMFQLLLIL